MRFFYLARIIFNGNLNTRTNEGWEFLAFWKKINSVLGLELHGQVEIPQDILDLVKEREDARKNKDFQSSDKLRDEIEKLGYIIEDTKDNNFIIKPARDV